MIDEVSNPTNDPKTQKERGKVGQSEVESYWKIRTKTLRARTHSQTNLGIRNGLTNATKGLKGKLDKRTK